MARIIIATALISLTLALPAFASSTNAAPQQCLNLTTATELNTSAITRNIGLTPIEVRELRARLTEYNSIRGFPGLDGLGLTDSQIATINARIAAQVAKTAHPLGYPCAAFTHRAKTAAFVRAMLIGNGFAAFSIQFYASGPRQIQFSAVLNGQKYAGAVARSGVRQITMQLTAPRPTPGDTQVFATPFDA